MPEKCLTKPTFRTNSISVRKVTRCLLNQSKSRRSLARRVLTNEILERGHPLVALYYLRASSFLRSDQPEVRIMRIDKVNAVKLAADCVLIVLSIWLIVLESLILFGHGVAAAT